MIVVGIDYSMSSPSICVHRGQDWSIDNCTFYFLTSRKKFVFPSNTFVGALHQEYTTQEERFNNIALWALANIPKSAKIGIEGYAYAAKGVVFDIGENTGILKHLLWNKKLSFEVFSPPSIKKFATGKGNANKLVMYGTFVEETQMDISAIIHCNEGDSPMSDIIDSYYIAKYMFFHNSN
jgi:hypothetical protein